MHSTMPEYNDDRLGAVGDAELGEDSAWSWDAEGAQLPSAPAANT